MRWAVVGILLIAVVIVPFVLFEPQVNAFAERITHGSGSAAVAAAGIGLLLALDVFLPVPSSIVSTAAGVLLGFWRGAAVVWIAMTAGCLLGYAVGARASGVARRIVGRDGLERASRMAGRYGNWTLIVCRPIPVLAEATVVFAGLVKAPFAHFLALTSAANLGIAVGYAAFGAFSMRLDSFLMAFVGAIVIPGIVMGLWKLAAERNRPMDG